MWRENYQTGLRSENFKLGQFLSCLCLWENCFDWPISLSYQRWEPIRPSCGFSSYLFEQMKQIGSVLKGVSDHSLIIILVLFSYLDQMKQMDSILKRVSDHFLKVLLCTFKMPKLMLYYNFWMLWVSVWLKN